MTGRPKKFERNDALQKALNVFWTKGYEATSVQDLLDAMNINRGSMYDTFGGKHELFMECIKNYSENWDAKMSLIFSEEGPELDKLHKILQNIESNLFDSDCKTCKGCFVTNTASELAQQDPEIGALIQSQYKALEKRFRKALKRALKAGEIPKNSPIKKQAAFIVSSMHGMVVSAKAGAPRETISNIKDVIMSALTLQAA